MARRQKPNQPGRPEASELSSTSFPAPQPTSGIGTQRLTLPVISLVISLVALVLPGMTFYRNFLYEHHELIAAVVGADPPSGVVDRAADRAFLVALINAGNREAVLVAGRVIFWSFNKPGWGTFVSRNETMPPGEWPEDYSPWLSERGLVIEPSQTKIVRVSLPHQGPIRATYQEQYWSGDQMLLGLALRTTDGMGRSFVSRFQIGVAGTDPPLKTEWFDWIAPSRSIRVPLFIDGDIPVFNDGTVDPLLKGRPSALPEGGRLTSYIEHAPALLDKGGNVNRRITVDPGP